MTAVQLAEQPREELKLPLYRTVKCKIDKLKHAEYNPRTISEAEMLALVNSIDQDKEFLMVRPLIVNTFPGREYIVIGGNQRLEAAKYLGWKSIPVTFVKVPQNREKKWNVKDNINNGEWDEAKRQEMFIEMRDDGMDLTDLSMTPEMVVDIIDMDMSAEDDPTDDPEYKGSTPSSGGKKNKHMLEVLQLAEPLIALYDYLLTNNLVDPKLNNKIFSEAAESVAELQDLKQEIAQEMQK